MVHSVGVFGNAFAFSFSAACLTVGFELLDDARRAGDDTDACAAAADLDVVELVVADEQRQAGLCARQSSF